MFTKRNARRKASENGQLSEAVKGGRSAEGSGPSREVVRHVTGVRYVKEVAADRKKGCGNATGHCTRDGTESAR